MIKIYMSRLKHETLVGMRILFSTVDCTAMDQVFPAQYPFLTVTWKSGCPWNRKKIAFIDFQVTWSKVTLLVLYLGAVFSIPK